MIHQLNYLWRLVGTAIGFIAFGIGGIVLTFLVFPIVGIVTPKDRIVAVSRKIVSYSFRSFINLLDFLNVYDFDIEQAERELAQYKGKVIVANHPSLIDVVILIAILPQADCVVKKALWNNPFLKGVVKAVGYIKNNEDPEELILACDKSLKAGYCLVIFPEGTRTLPGQPAKLQRGASNIALRCQADIVPVNIDCHPSTLTKNEPWYKIPSVKSKFKISVDKPIEIGEYSSPEVSVSVNARKLTEVIKQYIAGETKRYA